MRSNTRGSSNSSFLEAELGRISEMRDKEWEGLPVFARSRSLAVAEGCTYGNCIEFIRDVTYPITAFGDCKAIGDCMQIAPIPMSHDHVLWSYELACKRVSDDAYEFSLESIGPHLNDNKMRRPDPDVNCPSALEEPQLLYARIAFLDEKKTEGGRMSLLSSIEPPRRFSMRELIDLSVKGEHHIRVRFVVDRAYFSLAKIIDLDASTTVSRDRLETIDVILRGDKPLGWNWRLKVGGGKEEDGLGRSSSAQYPDVRNFYIHRDKLVQTGSYMKNEIEKWLASPAAVEAAGNECVLMLQFLVVDMRVVIPLLYGGPIPLPERCWMIERMRRIFGAKFLAKNLYPQWERAICKQAVAVDTSNLRSYVAMLRLLGVVFHCPIGSMPIAKRVVIGVLADMVHRNMGGRTMDMLNLVNDDASEAVGGKIEAMISLCRHLHTVILVDKKFVTFFVPAAAGDASSNKTGSVISPTDESLAATAAAAAVSSDFVIDLQSDNEEWHDAESFDLARESPAKWKCTIS